MRVHRYDTSRLDAVQVTPQGYLKIQAHPTRAGVLHYRDAQGKTIRELRPPSEVFSPQSLATLAHAPVTDLHPKAGQVTLDNHNALAVGHTGDSPMRDGHKVAVPVYVTDPGMAAKIQSGERKELSAGYYADTEDTPGVFEGQPYDRIQRNITYNHVALGPEGWGRAGPECALRLDSTDAIADMSNMLFRVDGKDYEAGSAECAAAIQALEASRGEHKGRADAAEAKLKAAKDPKVFAAAVKARLTLLSDIARGNRYFLKDADGEPAEPDTESDPVELMKAALKKWMPGLDLTDPGEIVGAFKAMLADVTSENEEAPQDGKQLPDENSLPKPGNTQPDLEMQQNGGNRSDAVRRRLNAPARAHRQDSDGNGPAFAFGKREDGKLSAEAQQKIDNAKLASEPLRAHRSA